MFEAIIIIVLVLLVVIIAYWYMNKVTISSLPSDMHPFSDLAQLIDPSVLPDAKDDYNDIILTLFDVINKQAKVLSLPNLPEYNKAIVSAMAPKLKKFSTKYTPEIASKLLKYFVTLHIIALLDNYYTGPPIKLMVPANPFLKMDSFPFIYTSKITSKIANASTLIPFKYLVYNIPKNIRKEVTTIYDNMIDRYAQAVNESVSKLSEVNMTTIRQVNVMSLMMKYQQMMTNDLNKIKQLYGSNVYKISKKVFMKNVVPLLDRYYRGPGIEIDQSIPSSLGSPYKKISIRYPNKDRKSIFELTETDSKTNTPSSVASTFKTVSTTPTTSTVSTIPTTSTASSFSSKR